MISGVSVSKGISFGKALILKNEKIIINKKNISINDINKEIKIFLVNRDKSISQIKKIININKNKLNQNKENIFNSHIMILEDCEFEKEIIYLIKNQLISADYATSKIIKKQIKILKKIKNDYLKERINDIIDIGDRLLKNILKINIIDLSYINDKVIIVSKELTPSETAQLNLKNVLGFITEFGSVTSHTSIMARSLELPAIVNIYNITNKIKNNDFIILDAINNNIYINPDKNIINLIKKKKNIYIKKIQELKKIKKYPAITIDGYKVSLFSNICNTKDINNISKYGSEGIGLYRTEFLFMNRNNLPNVKEQYKTYKYISKKIPKKKITIRIMDIGGDKNISYLNIPKEENPFLGWRAIRILMDFKKILYTQLKAILLSSDFKNIRIMFPMITFIEEIKYLKYELNNIIKILIIKKKKIDKKIKIGIMIETPSASLIIKDIIKEIDFLSIGTNDLTQYILAVDRGNKLVSHLYNPLLPSVIKSIKKIIYEAHKQNKYVSICGELASYEKVTLLLLGMGLDEFSMNSSYIPYIKNIIRKNKFKNATKISNLVLKQITLKKIEKCIFNK
ncbi:phosphoenolpyruvate--protein phosphotransferase [Enterobacteriaceae bacterium ET-AT1-13]|nr:phosphoenolpyruvate--protein phosphotransferase [Enterobacteriaceae bacterium ET-AT1-13]WGS66501.1 phosphoenolpyruvate--protein phosphotransferase [Enterobacteriaceae bacterium Cmel17]WMC17525.1 MAG: phosphoenolpyruvate--protein phosphotransferase [Enterobacteriaceae bacterium Cmel21]WMC17732.1 MAG: phosphoenolpyruvate--protein phosphotransferase [Enterobacteriaceae bacterium PSmelAO3-2]WMC17936.1 MAG: phosphoenolpyruvate--protein phosphotransferase [Enterobacteriaceae bacterium PSmelAO3-1]